MIAPQYSWIAVGVVIVFAVLLECHRDRQRLRRERVPRVVIEALLKECRDIQEEIKYCGGCRSDARLAVFTLKAERTVGDVAAPYLDVWLKAQSALAQDNPIALLRCLEPLEAALVKIAREL